MGIADMTTFFSKFRYGVYGSVIAIVAVLPASIASAASLDEFQARTHKSQNQYDAAAAKMTLDELNEYIAANPSPEGNLLLAKTALLVAELNRLDYEEDGVAPIEKRKLGKIIDAAGEIGHAAIQALESSSEKFRIEADLWAVMMRTTYQGKKYHKKMDHAAVMALQLDIDNPLAHITACKRPLFAKERRGGDLEDALNHLNRALELDPTLERALVFRGIAYDKLDQPDLAKKDWDRALELNPNSRMAQKSIETLAENFAKGG